jgi:hypothetical protein
VQLFAQLFTVAVVTLVSDVSAKATLIDFDLDAGGKPVTRPTDSSTRPR